jgi:hypothetical protein
MNHLEKSAFVSEIIEILKQEQQLLQEAGFNSNERINALTVKSHAAEQAEVGQKKAQAAAMVATDLANSKLNEAYNDASAVVELITGLLGKDNELVRKIKKIRK